MQKNTVFIILFLVVLLTGFFLSTKIKSENKLTQNILLDNATPSAIQAPNTYTSDQYKFSLEYPFNLQLKESSPTAITIGIINDLETNSNVEIKIIDSLIKPNATESAAITKAKTFCQSSMPNLEINCTKVIEEKQEDKTMNKVFYLEEVTKNKTTGEIITTEQVGPFIMVPLTKTKTIETFILFYPPLDKDPHLVNGQLIRDIANSYKKTN